MKKSILFFFVTLFSALSYIQAQPSEKLKQLFLDGEYFFLYEDFEEALYSYNTLFKRGYADNGNINYRMGQCYLNIPGEKNKAIPYLEKATKYASSSYTEGSFKETNAPYDSWYFLGIAYRINNQLDKAVSSFERFKELVGVKSIHAFQIADKGIASCNYAELAMKNPLRVTFSNLGRPVSTNTRDFFPAVSNDESVIVYNSSQKFYNGVFFSKKVNDKWTTSINITPEVQSDGNQYVSSVSFDGTELFLRFEDNFEANIYSTIYENGRWNKSKPLNNNINSKYFEGNACVTKDGQTLYFSSNRSGGIGSMDLYVSKKLNNNDWGPAENLGSIINTELNEDAPFISDDGKKMFFSSQGHNTIGGYDIFYSVLGSDGKWMPPINIGFPVNSTDDNSFFQPLNDGNVGYTSLYLAEGLGKEDIYRLNILGIDTTKTKNADSVQMQPLVVAKLPEKERLIPADVVDILTEPTISEKDKEKIVLRTLFFDFNSSSLTSESKKELDYLAMVLNNYPEIKIEFTGHSDAIGSNAYNKQLSFQRALSVKNYLILKSISKDRMQIKGLGSTNFIAINSNPNGTDNPEGRKYNRRVEIKILDIELENIISEKVYIPENLRIK